MFEPSEKAEAIALVVFRRTRVEAMRRWTAGGYGGNARMNLANYFKRQFSDHISTHEWDGVGSNDRRTRRERSIWLQMGIVRMPMTDAMCHPSPRIFLSLNEIIEWGMWAPPMAKPKWNGG